MTARKTVNVKDVIGRGNTYLLTSDDSNAAERRGMAFLMESILFDTDNYKGYKYLASEYLPAEEQKDDKVLRDNYDPTRRVYFV